MKKLIAPFHNFANAPKIVTKKVFIVRIKFIVALTLFSEHSHKNNRHLR